MRERRGVGPDGPTSPEERAQPSVDVRAGSGSAMTLPSALDAAMRASAGLSSQLLADAVLQAAEVADLGVTIAALDGGRATNLYVNDRAVAILGWPRSELLSRSALEFVSPDELPKLRALQERRARGEALESSFDTRVRRQSGEDVPVRVSLARLTLDGRELSIAFFVDLTRRRADEEAKRASEARFRALVEAAPDGIAITRNGRVAYANPAAVKLLGRDPVGQPWSELLEPEDHAAMAARVGAMMQTGERFPPREYRPRRPDGAALLIEITSDVIEYEGGAAIIGFARDVTERSRMREQLTRADRLAALGTLAAGVAHEINNPLSFVALGIDALERTLNATLPPEQRKESALLLEQIREGSTRVSSIVRDLRAFARVEDEALGVVDLVSVVEAAERLTAHELRHRARVVLDIGGRPVVHASPRRLEQVFVNLLLNAAQAFEERREGNLVTVRCAPAQSSTQVVVEVHDNGPGIPAEALARVFDPFFSTKTTGLGTGLGLSICHSIVTRLGGEISVQSGPATQGTTVRLSLPAHAAARVTPVSKPAVVAPERSRLLVVDDEPSLARTLAVLLRDRHEVTTVTSGERALPLLFGDPPPQVVLCDLMMPGLSGVDLFERVERERPELASRFVFMTGGAVTERVTSFLERIPNPRIEKPFQVDELEEILARSVHAE